MKIGFGIIGKEKDKASEIKETRWKTFRPSISFALQQNYNLERLVLAYQEGQEDLLERIISDISQERKAQGRKMEIERDLIHFQDPYDYNECFDKLYHALKKIKKNESDEIYLHTGTGSHTMQFAMYLLADKRIIPCFLVQTSPAEEFEKTDKRYAYGQARFIDLSWVNYPNIAKTIKQRRNKIEKDLLLNIPTKNKSFEDAIIEMAIVGSETNDEILIYGDTGTGKTRVAKVIHEKWEEKKAEGKLPFKSINCAGLTPELAQSELFGHVKGAFTGAIKDKNGMLTAANHGTLFLDEISELDLRTQAIMLKALEEKKFFKVGGLEEETSDFRLICASNKNLERLVFEGKFREDLLARLRKWTYRMPSLKDRREDIEENIKYELEEWFNNKEKERRSRIDFHPDALKQYLAFAFSPDAKWKGNFRDLSQSITRMATLASIKEKLYIDADIVHEEIQKLKASWQQSFSPNEGDYNQKQSREISDSSLAESLIQRFSQGTKCLVDEIEKFLQGYILQKYATKKKAGEILYQIPGKRLSNPSSKFRQKQFDL